MLFIFGSLDRGKGGGKRERLAILNFKFKYLCFITVFICYFSWEAWIPVWQLKWIKWPKDARDWPRNPLQTKHVLPCNAPPPPAQQGHPVRFILQWVPFECSLAWHSKPMRMLWTCAAPIAEDLTPPLLICLCHSYGKKRALEITRPHTQGQAVEEPLDGALLSPSLQYALHFSCSRLHRTKTWANGESNWKRSGEEKKSWLAPMQAKHQPLFSLK